MTDIELEEQLLITRARRALAPREVDQARVLAAVEQRIAGVAHMSEPAPTTRTLRHSWRSLASLLTKSVLGITLLGALGVAVSAVKWNVRDAAASSPLIRPTSTATAPRPDTPSAEQAAASPIAAEPAAPMQVLELAKAAALPEKKRPKPVPCRENCRHRAVPPRAEQPEATAIKPAQAPASSLRAELESVQRAEQALRAGQPAAALAIVEAFERGAADSGKLHEERSAAKTLAHCALAPARRSALLAAFHLHYPNSAYAERLRRGCTLAH